MINKTCLNNIPYIIALLKKEAACFLYYFLFLFLFPGYIFSQPAQYFENPIILNSNRGLSVGTVASVAVDKNGFLWIGGRNGLQRYDGHYFKKYTHDPEDSLSLIINSIRHLHYDEENHKLWITTWHTGGGLSVLDLNTETFKNYHYDLDKPGGITGDNQMWSYKDKFGTHWVSSKGKGMTRYLPEPDSFHAYTYEPLASEPNLDFERANTIPGHSQDPYNDSLLWLGSQAGLYQFNVVTNEFTRFPLISSIGKEFVIRTVFHHTDNQVYAGTWQDGLYRFDPVTKQFFKCHFAGHSEQTSSFINNIFSIAAKSKHRLWVKTKAGMVEYDTEQEQIVDFKPNEPDDKKIYGVDFIDKNGRAYVWKFGSIFIYDPMRQQVKPYTIEPKDKDFNFITRRIIEDKETGKLWIAPQMSKGLHRIDLSNNKWETFPPPKGYFKNKKTFGCWDILKTKRGELLVVDDDTIYQFSEKENKLVVWDIQPKIKNGSFRRMLEDRDGNIWLGTKWEGIFKIDPINKTVRHYISELLNEEKKSTGDMWYLEEDRNGNIWIKGHGYSVYDIRKDTFYNFPYFHPEKKEVYHMSSMGIDGNGDVWIAALRDFTGGTIGDVGVTDADHPEKGVIEYIDKEGGLKSGLINDIFVDKKKNMWLVSGNLEKINADKKDINFYSSAYLGNRSYSEIIELANGNVAVGYRQGVGIINLDSLAVYEEVASPYVQNFKIFDKEINLATSPFKNTEVYLKPNENFFSLEISALNPSFFGNLEFQYKLEGIDPDWVNPGQRKYVAYTNVASGSYTFKLKAKVENGSWNETAYELPVHIAAPWYKTWWAISIWTVLIFGIIYIVYHFQFLKKIAEKETGRLKELDEFRTRFYSNITHEFRTPLTVISGMADGLKENLKKDTDKKINLIKKNSEGLLSLVNQMLDLSKLQAGKSENKLQQSDIIIYLKYLVEAHESFAKMKNVGLQFYTEEKELLMDFDAKKMEQVLNNVISNAVKFTPEYGKILVVAKQYISEGNPFLEIKIKDTGIGISKEQLPYIFDRFHQANPIHENQGSGIGLALVKELVSIMDGEIKVESEREHGTVFYLHFPIKNNAPIVSINTDFNFKTPIVSINENTERPNFINDELPVLLIIEDNADVVYYLKTCLNGSYQIFNSRNGKLGIEKAQEILPDIIISDVMMPEMDGFEVCKILKEDERTDHIPIILLTAKATSEDKLMGLQYGADAYLTKPFEKEELLVRLEKLREVRKKLQLKYSSGLISQKTDNEIPKNNEEIFIEKLESIILKNIEKEDFSIHELSRALLLSRSQVHRKIKALTGMSTAVYIRHVRLEKAKELLTSTEMTVSEIAYEVGFKTPGYFSQVFKEVFGVSASEMREAGTPPPLLSRDSRPSL